MRILHHLPLSPQSRFVRLMLAEKKLPFELVVEKTWQPSERFHELNPAGEVPVLVEDNGMVVPGGRVIAEYLEDAYPEMSLMGRNLAERVEVRRLVDWFERLFQQEVMVNLLGEKVEKRLFGQGHPDGKILQAGYKNLRFHLDYIGYLAETRTWLGGPVLTAADFAAAAHFSALDFLGDIDWRRAPCVRDWYARIKSRPCFRSLLSDRVSGVKPPAHYADLDF
ncbi:glutathione S-transferase family protein [Bombella mellum]|uniref:Glutathione S-transferase n=1 Tax=Bombella mellum TaxID=2039288 RepID=A0ABR5ZT90_9PROT|nr:glutathione S-transferase family protein [Bombella mellum]MBA5727535.1 glutathione S-transferase [Bombella mellum]